MDCSQQDTTKPRTARITQEGKNSGILAPEGDFQTEKHLGNIFY
jgi:hypothetical protein